MSTIKRTCMVDVALFPGLHPDFISQLWRKFFFFLHSCERKSGQRPGNEAMMDVLEESIMQFLVVNRELAHLRTNLVVCVDQMFVCGCRCMCNVCVMWFKEAVVKQA